VTDGSSSCTEIDVSAHTTAPAPAAAFAAEHDTPIPYMLRTRDYYLALGFPPYRWAHFAEVPFTPLRTPLGRARVGLITTAAPFQPGAGDQGPGAPYNAAAKFYTVYSVPTDSVPDLRISHVGYDRRHTTAADPNTYLPLARLQEAVAAGRIGSLAPRLHGAPTNRSHRTTLESDVSELLRRCQEDAVDAVVLVPT
jgi:D-proline reductase (dithiol) PrdB